MPVIFLISSAHRLISIQESRSRESSGGQNCKHAPYVDVSRCPELVGQHRLGQTRPVTTVKFIIENSIEARLLEVQKKKTELANMTLGQNTSKADIALRRMEELSQLFNGS